MLPANKSVYKAQAKCIFLRHVEGMSNFQAGLCQHVLSPGGVLPCSFSGPHFLSVSISCRLFWMFVCMQACPKLIHVPALLPVTIGPFYLTPSPTNDAASPTSYPPLRNSSCFHFKYQWMKNPFSMQFLPPSITPLAELAFVTYRGVQAVVEMCDIRGGHPSCWHAASSCMAICGPCMTFHRQRGRRTRRSITQKDL